MKKGLIIQPGAVGDCILSLPLAQYMKHYLWLDRLNIMGHEEYVGILPERTCVDGIVRMRSADLNRLFSRADYHKMDYGDILGHTFGGYDWIASFLDDPTGHCYEVLQHVATIASGGTVIKMNFRPPKEYKDHISDFYIREFRDKSGHGSNDWSENKAERNIAPTKVDFVTGLELIHSMELDIGRTIIIIHPGAGLATKCWHFQNFIAVTKRLKAMGFEVIILLGPAELERLRTGTIKEIGSLGHCMWDLSLSQVLGLLSCVDGYIGNDSGITHVAGAMGIKTISLFGPTNPKVYHAIGPKVSVFVDHSANFSREPNESMQHEVIKAITT